MRQHVKVLIASCSVREDRLMVLEAAGGTGGHTDGACVQAAVYAVCTPGEAAVVGLVQGNDQHEVLMCAVGWPWEAHRVGPALSLGGTKRTCEESLRLVGIPPQYTCSTWQLDTLTQHRTSPELCVKVERLNALSNSHYSVVRHGLIFAVLTRSSSMLALERSLGTCNAESWSARGPSKAELERLKLWGGTRTFNSVLSDDHHGVRHAAASVLRCCTDISSIAYVNGRCCK